MGVAASIGLVLYFVAATVCHLRLGDVKCLVPAAFMLTVAAGALAMRILTRATPQRMEQSVLHLNAASFS
jgi:hypothetical protein